MINHVSLHQNCYVCTLCMLLVVIVAAKLDGSSAMGNSNSVV